MRSSEQQDTYQSAQQRAQRYCSYQERTETEVREKLRTWGIAQKSAADSIVQALKAACLLDEGRYIASFVRGKFFNKKWGQRKILYALTKKNLDQAPIQKGLALIEGADYERTLRCLAEQKNQSLATQDANQRQQKLMRYLLQKGYEPHLVQKTVQDILAAEHT